MVQFIPRIDLVALSADPETAAARKALRPPQRFFNPEEVRWFALLCCVPLRAYSYIRYIMRCFGGSCGVR